MPSQSEGGCVDICELIASLAEEFEAVVRSRTGDVLTVDVSLRRADGKVVPYLLAIDTSRRTPTVREFRPQELPSFCPQRHINPDATFCLNWQAAEPVIVSTRDDAINWWSRLLAFLRIQERATAARRWKGPEWAHGELAAQHQYVVEVAARTLGPRFQAALENGTLRVSSAKGKNRKHFLEIYDGTRRLYSVWKTDRRVANQRQICVCGSTSLALKSCSDHGKQAAALAIALHGLPIAERAFWKLFEGRTCCGTMDGCPLAESPPAPSMLAA